MSAASAKALIGGKPVSYLPSPTMRAVVDQMLGLDNVAFFTVRVLARRTGKTIEQVLRAMEQLAADGMVDCQKIGSRRVWQLTEDGKNRWR
jgi:hypothetical protein